MPRPPATALACLALCAAALAGCGSDNKSTSSTPPPPPPPPAASTPKASAATSSGAVKVTMMNIKFVPHDITAKVGQKIMWTNDDQIAHTVTATSGATFDSGNVNGGATFEFTPTKAGTIAYVCTIHPGQSGTITVTK